MMNVARNVTDTVATAEWLPRVTNAFQCLGDVLVIVGVFMA